MAGPRRLLLVSQRPLDYGGGGSVRWQFLREALPRLGWEVHSVTAPAGVTSNEASVDPRAARLAAGRAHVMGAIGRATRPLVRRTLGVQPEALAPNGLWSWTGRRAIRAALDVVRPDLVWATGPPASAFLAAAAVLRERPEPLVAELRDLWGGNPYFDAGGPLLPAVERRAFSRCQAVVSVTEGCRDRLLALHPEIAGRFVLLPNGFDPRLLDWRRAPRDRRAGDAAVLIHAGSLYRDRTAAHLIRALRRPELRGRARLELIGPLDGASEAELGPGVAHRPPVTWDEAIERTRAADIAVVINSPGTGGDMALPSKLYEALALGRPVLALTTPGSDTARLLARLGQDAGCAPPTDEAAIAGAVARLLDAPPPAVAPEALARWDRSAIAHDTAALLDGLIASGSPRAPQARRSSAA
ncbi:MAG: glycosyltransferase [Solirubrobacteraceae bacterium]